jgi:AraC family L-rhamnose operon regulatory protein RhaS
MRLEALVRGSYPRRRMPDCVLPQVSTIGYWDAVRDQTWGLGAHRNEGIEITYLENGSLGFVVDGRSTPCHPGISRSPFLGNRTASAIRTSPPAVSIG